MAAKRSIGDNSGELTEAQKRALYFDHFAKIRAQREHVDAAKKIEKQLRKDARRDGIVLKDIDWGLYIDKLDDQGKAVDQVLRHVEITRWMGLPVGVQSEFNFRKDNAAQREGAAAGFKAAKREPPYAPDTQDYQDWLTAYDGAQAQARADLQAAMEKKNAERKAAERRRNVEAEEPEEEGETTQRLN